MKSIQHLTVSDLMRQHLLLVLTLYVIPIPYSISRQYTIQLFLTGLILAKYVIFGFAQIFCCFFFPSSDIIAKNNSFLNVNKDIHSTIVGECAEFVYQKE